MLANIVAIAAIFVKPLSEHKYTYKILSQISLNFNLFLRKNEVCYVLRKNEVCYAFSNGSPRGTWLSATLVIYYFVKPRRAAPVP